MFNLVVDSKLHGCDVVANKVDDVAALAADISSRRTGLLLSSDPDDLCFP